MWGAKNLSFSTASTPALHAPEIPPSPRNLTAATRGAALPALLSLLLTVHALPSIAYLVSNLLQEDMHALQAGRQAGRLCANGGRPTGAVLGSALKSAPFRNSGCS